MKVKIFEKVARKTLRERVDIFILPGNRYDPQMIINFYEEVVQKIFGHLVDTLG